MGAWGDAPWDNDSAADWFGALLDETDLAARVAETLELDVEHHFQQVRAAATMLLFLGRPYVWPIDVLDKHLALAADKLDRIASMPGAASRVPVEAVRAEAALLRSRLDGAAARDPKMLASAWDALR